MSPRRLLVPGLALGLALGLTGCGAGLRAQTYQERSQAEATNEAIGEIAIRNLRILPPKGEGSAVHEAGEDARALLTVVNEGEETDRLTSVTSPLAASVEVVGLDGRPAELVVPGQSSTSAYAFVLRSLRSTVRTGEFVEMQLTFERNGSETMLVPVQLTGIPGERREGYEVAHTDSNGDVIVEHGEGEHEGEQGEEGGPQGGIDSEGGAGSGQSAGNDAGPEGGIDSEGGAGSGQSEGSSGSGEQGEGESH